MFELRIGWELIAYKIILYMASKPVNAVWREIRNDTFSTAKVNEEYTIGVDATEDIQCIAHFIAWSARSSRVSFTALFFIHRQGFSQRQMKCHFK